MWQTYSKSYLKNNMSACTSIMGASLIASTFLSLLCSLAYNLWAYQYGMENGQGSGIEITPLILFFLALLIIISLSLSLIIRSSFEMSMGARIHQLGILISIGATPKQVRLCLLQEAAALCAVPILIGYIFGTGLCIGVLEAVNFFAADVVGRQNAVFQYNGVVLAVSLLFSGLTILVSQYIPARKLSKLTPIQAIRTGNGLKLKKRRVSRLLSSVFGIEGQIAGNALKAQGKALRIANWSLLLSCLGFSLILCFTTLSAISTQHTYFERYQDSWDIMVTIKNTNLQDFPNIKEMQNIPGVREATTYQKAEVRYALPEAVQSKELRSLGGFSALSGEMTVDGYYQVEIPLVILDDDSFLVYCRQVGIPENLYGTIILNRIWDSVNSNFRYKSFIPFVKELPSSIDALGMPVLAYTQNIPVLREEYPNYSLVHFLSLTGWESLQEKPETQEDIFLRIFSDGDGSLEDLNALQERISSLLIEDYEVVIENRVQERISNDQMTAGMQWIFGFFCVLLAMIGIADVFSNTLGFLRNRKREFAQYMSVGLTPLQMRKLFAIEALVIAGRPLLVTLPLAVLFVEFAAKASYLDSMEFWAEAPILPIALFAAAIIAFVSLAYYIGGKSIMGCDLNETLRKDAIM